MKEWGFSSIPGKKKNIMQRKHLGNSWDSYYLINKRETMQAGV